MTHDTCFVLLPWGVLWAAAAGTFVYGEAVSMAKKKEPDRLSQRAAMAAAAGMSYGKWMALHAEELKTQPREPGKQMNRFVCQCCGKEFYMPDTRKRKYCGDECRMRAADLRELAKYNKKRKKVTQEVNK